VSLWKHIRRGWDIFCNFTSVVMALVPSFGIIFGVEIVL
jgi:hypothetical protein